MRHKGPNSDFQSQFSMSKMKLFFFSFKNDNLGDHFWIKTFFLTKFLNFEPLYFLNDNQFLTSSKYFFQKMKCLGFILGYIPPPCKKLDLIWNKWGSCYSWSSLQRFSCVQKMEAKKGLNLEWISCYCLDFSTCMKKRKRK